jgi:hypothetical protein
MTTVQHPRSCGSGMAVTVVALILIAAGVLLLLDNLGILWIDHIWDLWPLSLIAVGVAELIRWRRQSQS